MKHQRATHPPDYNCGPYGCNICNLFICEICGGAEGSLTTDCPGYKAPSIMGQLVFEGVIDFVGNRWIEKKSVGFTIRGNTVEVKHGL